MQLRKTRTFQLGSHLKKKENIIQLTNALPYESDHSNSMNIFLNTSPHVT